MGWIEVLAEERKFKSLRAVAQAMCKSPLWPAGDDRSPETVANKLRDADKGKDLGWWTGKGRPLLRVLAAVLQEDEDDFIEQLQAESSRMAGGAAWRPFKMFPALRPIDLHADDLFPGIPAEVTVAGGPKAARMWWVAPPGAGKTLAGDWLKARFGWIVRSAERWTELTLPEQGRVFVELGSTDDISTEVLQAIPKELRICVAAPRLPVAPSTTRSDSEMTGDGSSAVTEPTSLESTPEGDSHMTRGRSSAIPAAALPSEFQVVRTRPTRAWVGDLIEWVAARVKPGGGFDSERVRKMLRNEQLVALFETPGQLLELLGLVDHVGMDEFEADRRANDSLGWIGVWFKAALERPDRRRMVGIAELLGKRGPQILVQAEIERLRRDLASALPEPVWIDLMPRGYAPDVDRERLLNILDRGGAEAVAQARAMLAPDAGSVVQGLKTIGALEEIDAGRLALRPAWVANLITNAAIEQLDEDVPDGLGTLLLFKSTSEATQRRLIEEVRAAKLERAQACVASPGPLSPERMAALNGAFRAVGLALLAGASVPRTLLQATWEHQMAHVFRRYHLPIPILSVAAPDHWRGTTSESAWLAAAFAISLSLFVAGVDVGRSALNPWNGFPEEEHARVACEQALSRAALPLRANEGISDDDPFRIGIFRLGGDLLDRHGVVRSSKRILDIQHPDLLVALATGAGAAVSPEERRELVRIRFGLEAMEDACRRRGVVLADVLAWCWSIWNTEQGQWPPTEWVRGAKPRGAGRLWELAPADLSEELCERLTSEPRIWPLLPERVWARWLEVWAGERWQPDQVAGAFRALPENLVLQSVRVWGPGPWCEEIRKVVWERLPRALLVLIDELAADPATLRFEHEHGRNPISSIVYAAPDEHIGALIERVRTWLAEPARFQGVGDWLRGWLHHVVARRSTGWREAYELLSISVGEAQRTV
jgi:hypothetical protein